MIPSPAFYQDYFEYVIWADDLHLAAARQIPETEYLKERGFSFGSIHSVLRHEMGAMRVWLDRFEGIAQPVWLSDDKTIDSLAKIESLWHPLHARGRKFMASLTPEKLASTCTYANTKGQQFNLPLWGLAFHMCQHGYYHRSQINSMLKQAGAQPVSTEYYGWIHEKRV
jgi:uncharacterized damage-inducible protein DinB